MKISTLIAEGLAGTCTVALIHESLKKVTSASPRMELLDMEAVSRILKKINVKVPREDQLLQLTLAGEVISHTVYFGLPVTVSKKNVWLKGILLGLIAGVTAIVLPKAFGLNPTPGSRTPQTEAMTIAMYLTGGLATSAVSKWLMDKENKQEKKLLL